MEPKKDLAIVFEGHALRDWLRPLHLHIDWWGTSDAGEAELLADFTVGYPGCDPVLSVSKVFTNPPRWLGRLADRTGRRMMKMQAARHG
jgi:hypothetical protein